MSTHKSTKSTRSAKLVGGTAAAIPAARTGRVPKPRITRTHVLPTDPQSLKDFAELLKLRSLEDSTQAEYLRNVRRLGSQTNRDPADLARRAAVSSSLSGTTCGFQESRSSYWR